MEKTENPVFGRKIFFVSPSFSMENYLVNYLKDNEYEIYVIQEIHKIKNILFANPDSVCIINIDFDWSYSKWFSFLKSFEESEVLATTILGVVSEKAVWSDKDKFLMNVKLPLGFTILDKKNETLLKSFTDILEIYGTKGRRKYLRLDTRSMRDVSGYMTYSTKLYTFSVKDISSAGFAITYKQEIAGLFPKNAHVKNLCLSLGNKSLVCSCIVFNTRINQDGTAMSVLMLTNENPSSTRTYIKEYVHDKNEKKMRELINGLDKDSDHYKESEEYNTFRSVRDRDYKELNIIHGADSK